MKIAIFDVCGTLYDSNTTFDFLDVYFENNNKYNQFKKVRNIFLVKAINYLWYRYKKHDLIRAIATSFLRDEPEYKLRSAAKIFVRHDLEKKIQRSIVSLMNEYKEKGFYIILMSGSYDILVEHIQDYFGANDFFASELEIVDSQFTGKYKFDQRLNKKEVLQNNYPNISELIVVTDNRTDYSLMEDSTKGYAICNKPKQRIFWEEKKLQHVKQVIFYA